MYWTDCRLTMEPNMNIFGNAKEQLAGAEKEKDVLGGRSLLPTDVYDGNVEVAYLTTSGKGAKAFNFVFNVNGRQVRETIYVTNRAGEVTYSDKNGKKHALPGYSLVNALCKLTIGKEIPELTFETKLVKIYNFDLKKDVPTEVPVAVELLGQEVKLGIVQIRENKQVKDQTGEYVPTSEARELNSVERVFHPKTDHTIAEYDAQAPAEFMAAWLKEYKGKVRDKYKPVAGAPAAATSGGSAASKSSLFGG